MNTTPPPLAEPLAITRRHFFAKTAGGLGAIALSSLLPRAATAGSGIAAIPGRKTESVPAGGAYEQDRIDHGLAPERQTYQ